MFAFGQSDDSICNLFFFANDAFQVEYVINFDIPKNGFDYVHRIGRCGRVDRCGTAITFVSQYDIDRLYAIESHIQRKLEEFRVDKWQRKVTKMMEQVLLVRAGIVNGLETRYLMNPYEFQKKNDSIRWDGKFRDPRILGINVLEQRAAAERERAERAENAPYGPRTDAHQSAQRAMKEHEGLYKEFRSAFESEIGPENGDIEAERKRIEEEEEKQDKKRTKRFYKKLRKKEKKQGIIWKDDDDGGAHQKNERDGKEENEGNVDQFIDDAEDDDFDTNMHVIDEEVRLNNVDAKNRRNEGKDEEIGQDFHKLEGWQSFRYGKNGKRLRNAERIQRARDFIVKKNRMEKKRSRKWGKAPRLDMVSIVRPSTYGPAAPSDDAQKNGPTVGGKAYTSSGTVKSKQLGLRNAGKLFSKSRVQQRQKAKKLSNVKLSKSLQKKLSNEEREKFINKKASWFANDDMEWA